MDKDALAVLAKTHRREVVTEEILVLGEGLDSGDETFPRQSSALVL